MSRLSDAAHHEQPSALWKEEDDRARKRAHGLRPWGSRPHPALAYCYRALPAVSRTFALNIRALPSPLRAVVSVAYMLFRLVDTIEDAPGLPVAEKEKLFASFLALLGEPGEPRALGPDQWARLLGADLSHGERDIFLNAPLILQAFHQLHPRDQLIVATRVAETARGMHAVLARVQPDADGIWCLESWEDLEQYCYFVAGVVGLMLTELFEAHRRLISGSTAEALMGRAPRFGRALQLTNIIQDIGRDLGRRICYLPRRALTEAGLRPAEIADAGARERLLPVVASVMAEALVSLDVALEYALLVPRRETRVRLFCLWPLFGAARTLGIAAHSAHLARLGERPKMTRAQLFRDMGLLALESPCNRWIEATYRRLERRVQEGQVPLQG